MENLSLLSIEEARIYIFENWYNSIDLKFNSDYLEIIVKYFNTSELFEDWIIYIYNFRYINWGNDKIYPKCNLSIFHPILYSASFIRKILIIYPHLINFFTKSPLFRGKITFAGLPDTGIEIIKLFLELNEQKKAFNLIDSRGNTIFHHINNSKDLKLFLALPNLTKEEILLKNNNGESPFHTINKSKCLKLFLAIPNLTKEEILSIDNYGQNPFFKISYIKCLELFLKIPRLVKEDITLLDKDGKNIFYYIYSIKKLKLIFERFDFNDTDIIDSTNKDGPFDNLIEELYDIKHIYRYIKLMLTIQDINGNDMNFNDVLSDYIYEQMDLGENKKLLKKIIRLIS